MAAEAPSIPVRQTTKTLYRPICKLHGDQLPMLRKIKRPELSGRTSLYNHYTQELLNTRLNVSYRQHEHTMDTLRKEQAHVYQYLCKMKRLQRRVQRDEHEQRREDIRNMFKRQRRRHLMRRVVERFRQNVVKKRAERMLHEAVVTSGGEEGSTKQEAVLSAEGLLKYAGALRRHTQPNVGKEAGAITTASPGKSDADGEEGENVQKQTGKPALNAALDDQNKSTLMKEKHALLEQGAQIRDESSSSTISKTSKRTRSGNDNRAGKVSRKRPQPGMNQLQAIPEGNSTDKARIKSSQQDSDNRGSLPPNKRLQSIHSSSSLPADLSDLTANGVTSDLTGNGVPSDLTGKGVTKSCPHDSVNELETSPSSTPYLAGLARTDQIVYDKEKGFCNHYDPDQDFEDQCWHQKCFPRVKADSGYDEDILDTREIMGTSLDSYLSKITEMSDGDDHSLEPTGWNGGGDVILPIISTTKKRENMVKVIEKERADRAKARTRILDEEPITRYSRKAQSTVRPMHGEPRRREFVPPTGKVRHEQEKLIRREQDKEIQSQINIERFFNDVFQSKDTVVKKQGTNTPIEAPKKATLSLAGVLSQLYTSADSTEKDQNSLESLRACQYLRQYKPFQRKNPKAPQAESSWDVAERKLRCGFMALNFLK